MQNIKIKADLVNEVSRKTGIERKLVMATIESAMDVIKETMINQENVYLRGFGSFVVKERAAKTARNISKNTTIQLPARKVPTFKPSKTFAEKVDKNK